MALALQITQHDGQAVLLRQTADFLIEDRPHLRPKRLRIGCFGLHGRRQPFVFPAPAGIGATAGGNPRCHAVQPTADRITFANGTRFLGENQERGLKCILGVAGVLQDAAANTVDHLPMPLNQSGEGTFIPVGPEAVEQLTIGQVAGRSCREQETDVPENGAKLPLGHDLDLPEIAYLHP